MHCQIPNGRIVTSLIFLIVPNRYALINHTKYTNKLFTNWTKLDDIKHVKVTLFIDVRISKW